MHKKYHIASNAVIHELLDDEIIAANLASGIYYSIRGTGISVWQLLLAGKTVLEIEAVFTTHYSIDAISQDLNTFIDRLVTEQLFAIGDVNEISNPEEIFWPTQFTTPTLEKYEEMRDLLVLDPIHEVDEQGWPHRADN